MSTELTVLLSILFTITTPWQPTCPKSEAANHDCLPYNLCETCHNPLCGLCQNTGDAFCREWDCMTCISGYTLLQYWDDGTGFCYNSSWSDTYVDDYIYTSWYSYWIPPNISTTSAATTPGPKSSAESRQDEGDGGSALDSQTVIIIVLACSLTFVICCIVIVVIIYIVYRRGVTKGRKTAGETGNIVNAKSQQGETSNMNIFTSEHEEAPPAAYNSIPMTSIAEQTGNISPRQAKISGGIGIIDTAAADAGRGEGHETAAFENVNSDGNEDKIKDEKDHGPGAQNEDKEKHDHEKQQDDGNDSDTMEMYENNDAAKIAMPDDESKNVDRVKSGSVDSNEPKEDIAGRMKIKNVNSLDDLYEPQENETRQTTNGDNENVDTTKEYKD